MNQPLTSRARPARAFLTSYLAFRRRMRPESFDAEFPGPWLLWEPGAWVVPSKLQSRTLLGTTPSQPLQGDALCFELRLAEGERTMVGRNPEHALVINEATFSRTQFVLGRTASGYEVATVPGAREALLNERPVMFVPRRLEVGDSLVAGNVTLRFLDSPALLERLQSFVPAVPR